MEEREFPEILLSQSRTGFFINHYSSFIQKGEKYIKGGDVIRLFHQEIEGFLTSNVTPLYGKYSAFFSLKKSARSKSSNNIFQIELENSIKGGVVIWRTTFIRFKHLGTGKYLTLKDPNKPRAIQLSKTPNKANLFVLFPVDNQTSSHNWVEHFTFFRIRHSSGLWFSSDKQNPILDPHVSKDERHFSKASKHHSYFEVNLFFKKKLSFFFSSFF